MVLVYRERGDISPDGHVHFVKDTVRLSTFRVIATVNGGEVISSDSL